MVTLISLRPLSGDYGAIPANHIFTVDEKTAESLESRGLAARYRLPNPASFFRVEKKMERAYENKAIQVDSDKADGLNGERPEESKLETFLTSFKRSPGRPKKVR